jgi:hypothetical protein
MNNGETPPPKPGLTLTPEQTNTHDAPTATPFRSRTDELLANSSLSLMPVENAPENEAEALVAADENEEPVPSETIEVAIDDLVAAEPAAQVSETVPEAAADISALDEPSAAPELVAETVSLNHTAEPAVTVELTLEPVAELAVSTPVAIDLHATTEELTTIEPVESLQEEALTPPQEPDLVDLSAEPVELPATEIAPENSTAAEAEITAASPFSLTLEPLDTERDETAAPVTPPISAPSELSLEAVDAAVPVEAPASIAPLTAESATPETPVEPAANIDETATPLTLEPSADTPPPRTGKAVFEARPVQGQAEHVFETLSPPVKKVVEPDTDASPPADVAETAVERVTSSAADASLALEPSADTPPPRTGKAVFEARPVQGQAEHVLETQPPPVKKVVEPEATVAAELEEEVAPAPQVETVPSAKPKAVPAPTPAPPPAPEPEPAPVEEPKRAKSGGLFAKVGEWKGHLNYLHNLYKEDPTTAVSHWKQTFKERGALAEALQQLQERQNADNFAWEEIPRTLEQFHLRDDDRGQADWYGDAARQYQVVLNAIEKQKTFKPALIQPLLKELKFIAEADAFHQKYGLTAIQQKVKTMYQTLQYRIDEYMKLQKQQLELAVKDKEIEKLRAQEAIATAEAQKVAQENRLVQEQRLKVVEDKKRLEAKRAAEEAERVRLERQREIEAEQAEVRRREELSASFRAIEQEELMRKALQNMSLSQCAEGLLRQLFEKDALNEQERASAARVLDVLKAKLG